MKNEIIEFQQPFLGEHKKKKISMILVTDGLIANKYIEYGYTFTL